ncbi:alpha/beta fold hydrolase [Roseiterribacter gracilis]|uniref:Alpha/beta hydrolase n=1 Tax=Roseiterribacter gracilis TaxID=2812848 RepID=A0A8S8XA86_9PROT|nr:alpha/beta hydrolase [Rhodospirillales bacterium TMPK1]
MPAGLFALAAGFLATRALLEARRAKRAARDFPPRGRMITVNGVKLHVVEQGDGGSPIVLLHGNGATTEDFRLSGLQDQLARTHRVISIDRPGFGFSERPRGRWWDATAQARLIQDALDQLEIERPILVGHSWGTLVALAMALTHPDRVAGLALLSGYYFTEPRPAILPMLPSALPVIGDILRYTLSPPLTRALRGPAYRKLFRPAQVTPRFEHEFPLALAARPSQLRAVAADTATMMPSAARLQHHYRTLHMPVAIVSGDGDRIVDPAVHAERLHTAIAGSALTIIPGAGHMVHHSASAAVLRAIQDLAERIDEDGFAHAQQNKEERLLSVVAT